jgi:hypothetical protein
MMFENFIRLLSDGKTYSQYELSKKLDVSIETVQAFIEYLSIKRILSCVEYQAEESSCSTYCNRCTGCKGCVKKQPPGHTPTLWEFRKKVT